MSLSDHIDTLADVGFLLADKAPGNIDPYLYRPGVALYAWAINPAGMVVSILDWGEEGVAIEINDDRAWCHGEATFPATRYGYVMATAAAVAAAKVTP